MSWPTFCFILSHSLFAQWCIFSICVPLASHKVQPWLCPCWLTGQKCLYLSVLTPDLEVKWICHSRSENLQLWSLLPQICSRDNSAHLGPLIIYIMNLCEVPRAIIDSTKVLTLIHKTLLGKLAVSSTANLWTWCMRQGFSEVLCHAC